MTQLDLFRATVEHRPHEDYLYHAGFTPDLEHRMREHLELSDGSSLSEHLGFFSPVSVTHRPPENSQKHDFWHYYEDMDVPEGSKLDGFGVLHAPGSVYHFTHRISPLRNAQKLEDLEAFPYPDLEGHTEDLMAAAVEDAHRQGRVAVCWVGHMYETAWQIRDYEEFLIDAATRPEWCEYILDRLMERNLRVAEAGARAGVDYLRSGDDVANQRDLMFAPPVWRNLIKSRWEKVYAAARAIKPDIDIWYHSDGNIGPIIPELVDIGVTILNPVQPECLDIHDIKRRFGDRIVLDGTIGTQTTMPWGTPDEVRQTVRNRVRDLGQDGALMLAPTHVLEPEVPVENVLAFVESASSGD